MSPGFPLTPFIPLLLLALFVGVVSAAAGYSRQQQQQQRPLNPSDLTSSAGATDPNTVPAFPVVQAQNNQTCHLDLSAELFGGVAEACGRDLDRSRCCPVLAAWLFAAHARSALEVRAPADGDPSSSSSGAAAALGADLPMMPDDSQKCVDSLQSSLQSRDIYLARPNASCDAVLCFCGIRLHQVTSLSCPAAFNISAPPPSSSSASPPTSRNATPTAAVRDLERNCRNSSYAGCTRCLESLAKLKGGVAGGGDRASRMFGRDCQLMGLTWLLARNKTAYIPTVSAVLRAIMYSAYPPQQQQQQQRQRGGGGGKQQQYRCSPDQENMPLAVDSLQFEKLDGSHAAPRAESYAVTVLSLSSLFFLFPLLFSSS